MPGVRGLLGKSLGAGSVLWSADVRALDPFTRNPRRSCVSAAVSQAKGVSAYEGLPADAGVRSQLLAREVNEQIRSIAVGFEVEEALDLICECQNGCFETIALPWDAYEAIRRFP